MTARTAMLAAATLLLAAAAPVNAEAPRYDPTGRLLFPAGYREWVFLSSGVDMSYTDQPAMQGAHMFDNVFAPRAAYAYFLAHGVWPDKTVLLLENRGAAAKGSINRRGLFQTGDIMAAEAHVKDIARFPGGWAFFSFNGTQPAAPIPATARCYACHRAHAAADTTFVQFYPTLLPTATQCGTLNPAYLNDQSTSTRTGNLSK